MASADESKPAKEMTVRTRGTLGGFTWEIEMQLEARHLPAFARRLREVGVEPEARPLAFDLTAEGLPICPKHRVPMRRREKQGDAWHSHAVPAGADKVFCRGYPDPVSSPGYFHDMVGPDPEDADPADPGSDPPDPSPGVPYPQATPALPPPSPPGRGPYPPERPPARRGFGRGIDPT